ncbi:tetratricopeptide repeat protein [Acidomonas methanolica]|nr:tetratricopeptide repeat protein [Acidomonas methanolica]MBU2653577.1 tetratricopeptide repeat protein [Acidomonas methanolica]TCS31528.1 Flp pilus assembly protein TadD [Acidomonas methanolica]GBQ47649.1 O-linked N-acetylglucosamine transferase [Acidomonas methanolica]
MSMSAPASSAADETLADSFMRRDLAELARLSAAEAENDPVGPHPLAALLDHAACANRRDDLLATVDMLLDSGDPDDPRLLELRGHLLLQTGRLTAAEEAARRSLDRRPHHKAGINLLVGVLMQQGRLSDAEALLREQLEREPDDATLNTNLAVILTGQDRMDEALPCYRRAILAAPSRAQIRLNHSITLLKAAQFAQGWAEHEWRLDLPGHSSLPRDRILPNIVPGLDLRNKHVLVTQEEGLGDTLMYLRFIPPLARLGARITIWGPEVLARLAARVDGVAECKIGGETPEYDYHCPFISLPRAFAASPTPFGAPVPYLPADPAKRAYWSRRLSADRHYRVGLVWSGAPRPENTEAHMVDQRRSMPLAALAPLRELENMTFYSLQKGPAAAQLEEAPFDIVDHTEELTDMDDTAALIANLDVVVSVDTSIVHLAGGMGMRVLMMDRFNPCWRWMSGRTDSPWYPGLTLFRQTKPYDWAPVVQGVAGALRRESGR